MSRAPRRISVGDRLAYVDDCLPPMDRAAVEAAMREDPGLKSQIENWLLQNEALRAAYPDSSAKAAASGGWTMADWMLVPDLMWHGSGKHAAEAPRGAHGAPVSEIAQKAGAAPAAPLSPAASHGTARRRARKMLFALALALGAWMGPALFSPNDGGARFAAAATAAYRTYAEGRTQPVEIATPDREMLSQWFAGQIAGLSPIPDLSASGFTLIGGRIATGAFSPAAFALYENAQRERIALAMETLDAPPRSAITVEESGELACASWTEGGRGLAIVGRAPGTRLAALARLVRRAAD